MINLPHISRKVRLFFCGQALLNCLQDRTVRIRFLKRLLSGVVFNTIKYYSEVADERQAGRRSSLHGKKWLSPAEVLACKV